MIDFTKTLIESGQCFHWRRVKDAYVAVVDGRVLCVTSEDDIRDAADQHYFGLNRDEGAVRAAAQRHPASKRAYAAYPGLAVLCQPPWEALFAFLLSQNNNIPRIRGLVDRLSRTYGERFDTSYGPLYGMPSPERLAMCTEEELRSLGTGYRANYLLGSSRMVAEGFPLNALQEYSYENALREIKRLPGVGEKVADCVLLFGCGHTCAFPVDVWMEKLLRSWFHMEGRTRMELKEQAMALFGEQAGIVQQYLFEAARSGMFPV